MTEKIKEFVGVWRQESPDDHGNLCKTDFVTCEEAGDRLTGNIRRLLPESERFKRWHFEARVENGVLLGLFWPWNNDEVGYGSIYLHVAGIQPLQGLLLELSLDPQSATGPALRPVSWVRA